MQHRPKPVRDHYTESLAVNSESLARQLAEAGVPEEDVRKAMHAITDNYLREVEKIVQECEADMMALEKVPSPLGLFVGSIAKVRLHQQPLPAGADSLLARYVAAWEDWM
jgi:hypothetical protein